jgi:hypothetical protein
MGVSRYRDLVKVAMQANSEEECEEAMQLFERMLEDITNKNFSDFDAFADLAIFLAKDIWSEQGMFDEPSSQLFAEYGIGAIDWIWSDSKFLATLPQFLKDDIHFGCFILTEGRSNVEFTSLFADMALKEECEICSQMGDGWISAAAYVAEDAFAEVELLENYYLYFKKEFDSGKEDEKYNAIEVLRSLAENPKTPENILRDLAQIHENSLSHEIRSVNGGEDPQDAIRNSYIDWKARETLGFM